MVNLLQINLKYFKLAENPYYTIPDITSIGLHRGDLMCMFYLEDVIWKT